MRIGLNFRRTQVSTPANQTFLSEDEMLFHRMESFHRQRVELIATGHSPLGMREDGFLVIHLIPHSAFKYRERFDGSKLKQHGSKLPAFWDQGGYAYSRFNVDGLLNIDSEQAPESYSQIFRNGHLEAVMSAVTFEANRRFAQPDEQSVKQPRYFRDAACERAVFKLVPEYFSFCKGIGIPEPINLSSALVGCKGVRFYSSWGDRSGRSIDRSPAYLPDINVEFSDAEPEKWLQPWCDFLAQAMGLECSPNYEESGTWQERQR
jgi:hypothetical protein